ncbi:MAG: hypothetical protein ABL876_07245 [Chitinophagaceae bacterium]
MKKGLFFLATAGYLLIVNGCGQNAPPFTEKRLVIASKETVKVPELNLTITNNGCGRQWMSEDGKPEYERAFCDIVIKLKDSSAWLGRDRNPVYIGNVKVLLDKMNPWGREEDSVPAGGCRVIVTKLTDTQR